MLNGAVAAEMLAPAVVNVAVAGGVNFNMHTCPRTAAATTTLVFISKAKGATTPLLPPSPAAVAATSTAPTSQSLTYLQQLEQIVAAVATGGPGISAAVAAATSTPNSSAPFSEIGASTAGTAATQVPPTTTNQL